VTFRFTASKTNTLKTWCVLGEELMALVLQHTLPKVLGVAEILAFYTIMQNDY
jgi:hypothetical protein